MTRLRQRMLEELQRRNYSQETTRSYIQAVKQFAEYFGRSPQELGAEEIRRYQLYLLNEKKHAAGTVKVHMSSLRFLYRKVLKRRDLPALCPAEACHPITDAGFPHQAISSCRSASSAVSFVENS